MHTLMATVIGTLVVIGTLAALAGGMYLTRCLGLCFLGLFGHEAIEEYSKNGAEPIPFAIGMLIEMIFIVGYIVGNVILH